MEEPNMNKTEQEEEREEDVSSFQEISIEEISIDGICGVY
jgi:mycofactocin precursor